MGKGSGEAAVRQSLLDPQHPFLACTAGKKLPVVLFGTHLVLFRSVYGRVQGLLLAL